jgi:hypothetical protein
MSRSRQPRDRVSACKQPAPHLASLGNSRPLRTGANTLSLTVVAQAELIGLARIELTLLPSSDDPPRVMLPNPHRAISVSASVGGKQLGNAQLKRLFYADNTIITGGLRAERGTFDSPLLLRNATLAPLGEEPVCSVFI